MSLKIGKKSPKSAIYKCSACGNLHALLEGEIASPCEVCAAKGRQQHWVSTRKELFTATKNVRRDIDEKKTRMDRISDKVTDFCGNIRFVYVHILWFGGWLAYNSLASEPFDPYPFGMLTLVVSLEAIILATFILISQNRQSEISELRSELDYQIDLKSEKNTAAMLAMLKELVEHVKREHENGDRNE